MWNLKIQVSKLDPTTELRLYVGASIPKDKTKNKIQEQFKNILILFKNTSDVENVIAIDLKVFSKKFNVIITKDKYKYQQEQNYESLCIIKV